MMYFGVYKPQIVLTVMVSMYAIFIGLVLYLILALGDPFRGGIGVEPATFMHLVETMQAEDR